MNDNLLITGGNLYLKFIYCDLHDQGAVAIITQNEWFNMITKFKDYNVLVLEYVISMCGNNSKKCKCSWRCCGTLEYNPINESLLSIDKVQTDFKKENGGWKFKYFADELYTLNDKIEINKLPLLIQKYLSEINHKP